VSAQSIQAVLLFGAPGVGKGTQGKALGCVPGFVHFSMGDAFRSLSPTSVLGKKAAEYTSRGELVPDETTIQLFHARLGELESRGVYRPDRDILALDGIPRSVRQVELLNEKVQTLAVVHLACTSGAAEAELISRLRKRALEQNRADDAREDVIRRRFEVYRAETAPVLERFPPEIVSTVDPIGTPAEVLMRVLAVVAPVQRAAMDARASSAA